MRRMVTSWMLEVNKYPALIPLHYKYINLLKVDAVSLNCPNFVLSGLRGANV